MSKRLKRLDTTWFNLNNYEPFKDMSIEDWAWQLECRYLCYRLTDPDDPYAMDMEMSLRKTGDSELKRYLLMILPELKKGVIPRPNNSETKPPSGQPFSIVSVNSLSNWQLWLMANEMEPSPAWKACEKLADVGYITDDKQNKLISAPYDFNDYLYNDDYLSEAHVVIDLAAADEQIKKDFDKWLKRFRKAINDHRKRKLFTQNDFDDWIESRAIPYLDLMLIAKIESKKITQSTIASLIFADDEETDDVLYKLRQVTIPKAIKLIENETHKRLWAQAMGTIFKK